MMRLYLWAMAFFAATPALGADDIIADPRGASPNFEERFKGQPILCSLGRLCADAGADTQWQDHIVNIDLMRMEMARLKIRNRSRAAFIDTGLSDKVAKKLKSKVALLTAAADTDIVMASDDTIGHGTNILSVFLQAKPRANVSMFSDQSERRSIEQTLNNEEDACAQKHQVLNVSSAPVGTAKTFENFRPGFHKKLRAKGCLVIYAAGNFGGTRYEDAPTVAGIDRSGKLAKFAEGQSSAEGSIRAAGGLMAVASSPNEASLSPPARCSKDFVLKWGSSMAAPQVSAVADNVFDIFLAHENFRTMDDERKVDLVTQVLYSSMLRGGVVDRRLDGYRAVKLAQEVASQISPKMDVNVKEAARFTWDRIKANNHNAYLTTCATKTDCAEKKKCYDDKRRWLTGATEDSPQTKEVLKDLFLTAHNTGDFELAQNWAARLGEAGAKGELEKAIDWQEFRQRVKRQNPRLSPLLDDYIRVVSPFVAIPEDLNSPHKIREMILEK